MIEAGIGSFVGAFLLRAACWLYNRMAGATKVSETIVVKEEESNRRNEFSVQAGVSSSESPFAPPAYVPEKVARKNSIQTQRGVPIPSFASAFVTCVICYVIFLATAFCFGVVFVPVSINAYVGIVLAIFTGMIWIVVPALVFSYRLPTTFAKGIKLALLCLAIVVAIGIACAFATEVLTRAIMRS